MQIEILSLVIFGASMIGTPGPANMVVMASGARFGFRRSVPFLAGVILGKQAIIWPLGLGIGAVIASGGPIYQVLRVASVAYVLWLAWRIAGTRIKPGEPGAAPPSFLAGLIVHPLNPKAWALILASMANFVDPGTPPLMAAATMSVVFLGLQICLQSLWTLAGVGMARAVAGTPREVWLMRLLAGLMVASVAAALLKGT